MMVDENGKQTITNDGATVMKVGLFRLFVLYKAGLPVYTSAFTR